MTFHSAPLHRNASAGRGEIPSAPPIEVLDAIGAAGEACDRLQAAGREVRFDIDACGRPRAQLRRTDGTFLKTLSARQVIELATGGPLL